VAAGEVGGICAGRRMESRVFQDAIRNCGRTGSWACDVVPWREPYERRRSRTVLREPRVRFPGATQRLFLVGEEEKAIVAYPPTKHAFPLVPWRAGGPAKGAGPYGARNFDASAAHWSRAKPTFSITSREVSPKPSGPLGRDRCI
jgi:hypothetical protein